MSTPTTERSTKVPSIRRSPMMMVSGVLLIVIGMLISAAIYINLNKTQAVLAIVSEVGRGQQITRADLATVQVGFDPMLKPIPASEIDSIVGKYATKDLVVGTFITYQSYGDRVSPAVGESEVGVALTAGEYPDDDLEPGNKVKLVTIPEVGDPELPTGGIDGTIATIRTSGNSLIVSVLVSDENAPKVAALSAANRLALILTSRR